MDNTPSMSELAAANIRRMRESRGWSLKEMCGELEKAGWPMNVSTLSKKERSGLPADGGRRRSDTLKVSVDDLAAFARVFGVAADALLTAAAFLPAEARSAASQFVKRRSEEAKVLIELEQLEVALEDAKAEYETLGRLADEAGRALAQLPSEDHAGIRSYLVERGDQGIADDFDQFVSEIRESR